MILSRLLPACTALTLLAGPAPAQPVDDGGRPPLVLPDAAFVQGPGQAVMLVDLAKFTPYDLRECLASLIGDGWTEELLERAPDFEKLYIEFIASGGRAFGVLLPNDSWREEASGPDEPRLLLNIDQGADIEMIIGAIDGLEDTGVDPESMRPYDDGWHIQHIELEEDQAPWEAVPDDTLQIHRLREALQYAGPQPIVMVFSQAPQAQQETREALDFDPAEDVDEEMLEAMGEEERQMIEAASGFSKLMVNLASSEWIAMRFSPVPALDMQITAKMPDVELAQTTFTQIGAARNLMNMMALMASSQIEEEEERDEMNVGLTIFNTIRITQEGPYLHAALTAEHVPTIRESLEPMIERADKRRARAPSTANMREFQSAFSRWRHSEERDEFPASLEEFREGGYVSDLDAIMRNPVTGDEPGYLYVKPDKPYSELENPWTTPILYELKNGRVDPDGAVLYANGRLRQGPNNRDARAAAEKGL